LSKKRILIVPNSFKECADSVTIAKLIKNNLEWNKNLEIIMRPISDGGDGFLKVCQFYFGGEFRHYKITTPYDESIFECPVLYCERRRELFIESAEVLGLKRVPEHNRKPLKLSSKGIGEILNYIQQEVDNGKIAVDKVCIGIGGTAAIDMGMGMMSKLGLKLLDQMSYELDVLPINYLSVEDIQYEKMNLSFAINLIADVNNPLLGENGGVRIYGRQKGASERNIKVLEKSFTHLLKVFEKNDLTNPSKTYSGAGGGLPAALQIFYNCKISSSTELIQQTANLDNFTNRIDYLITGEGAFDSQSFFGKGASILIEKYKSRVDQIFLICGVIKLDSSFSFPYNVVPIELVRYFNSSSESIQKYDQGLEFACKEIVNQIKF